MVGRVSVTTYILSKEASWASSCPVSVSLLFPLNGVRPSLPCMTRSSSSSSSSLAVLPPLCFTSLVHFLEVSVFQAVTQKLPENLFLDVFAHESEFRMQSHKLLANMALPFIRMCGVYVHVTVLGSHSEPSQPNSFNL